jgi:hypothetical protein
VFFPAVVWPAVVWPDVVWPDVVWPDVADSIHGLTTAQARGIEAHLLEIMQPVRTRVEA